MARSIAAAGTSPVIAEAQIHGGEAARRLRRPLGDQLGGQRRAGRGGPCAGCRRRPRPCSWPAPGRAPRPATDRPSNRRRWSPARLRTAAKRRSPCQVMVKSDRRLGHRASVLQRPLTRARSRRSRALADMLDSGISYSIMTTQPPADVLREAKKGSAELVILALLEDTPRHGYELAARIEQRVRRRPQLQLRLALRDALQARRARLDPGPLGRARRASGGGATID